MCNELISRSSDLKRLRDEGYNITINTGWLVVSDVPYVNAQKQIKFGVFVCKLVLAGNVTAPPDDHVAHFHGEYPCSHDGAELEAIRNQSNKQQLADGVVVEHTFSAKPRPSGRYDNYYSKVATYIGIISGPAQAIDKSVTAKTFHVVEACAEEENVFHYIDTASSRAEIDLVTKKLKRQRLAIVGGGGTASYILDLVAKTPAKEIHIYDRDIFLQHNAFRSPGAPSIDELRTQPKKVDYLAGIYSKMHRQIFPHAVFIDASNIHELFEMNFVFLAFDGGDEKQFVVRELEEASVPFVDIGMGVTQVNEALGGILRVTTSTPQKRDHVWDKHRIPFYDGGPNDYDQNIQIADLNALNAAFAVIRWKKHLGFYRDYSNEHYTAYAIDGNKLFNEDHP